MKILRELWREFSCIFLSSAFVCFLFLWFTAPPQSKVGLFWFFVASALDLLFLWLLLRQLWRKKWKRALTQIERALFAKATKFVMRLLEYFSEKRSLGSPQKRTLLSGTTSVTFDRDFFAPQTKNKNKNKSVKWKQLKTDRERLRFLYRHMIKARMKSGMRVHANDTPLELQNRQSNRAGEEELFRLYIDVRYDDRTNPSPQAIQKLKQDFEIR